MKRYVAFALLPLSLAASPAFARNTIHDYSINGALASGADKVGSDVALYFAGQPHAPVVKSFGEAATNKKTNAFGKSDEAACQHVFLSAMLQLQDRARQQGGNAVINIRSNYKGEETPSATTFRCGAGAVVAGVALKGDVVTLEGVAKK
jgi:uncharacterized protein YbjQ (UPF0145 family)